MRLYFVLTFDASFWISMEMQRSAFGTFRNNENYHKTINWLDDHRFYLTTDQCNAVNKEFARIRSAPMEVGEIRLEIQPFAPHPAMNDNYYLPESDP
jgi:hypothetical protein